MKRDSSAGAFHGLVKRGMGVGIANHGRAEAAHSTGLSERRSREDAESVGAPTTQRTSCASIAWIVTERSDGAIHADATRRGAVDITNHGGRGAELGFKQVA